jgi:aldehyde dehydrogenase (NAD+)
MNTQAPPEVHPSLASAAKDTVFGLGGAVWTRDVSAALTMARGIRMSGYGSKGGPHPVDAFLYQKNIYISQG